MLALGTSCLRGMNLRGSRVTLIAQKKFSKESSEVVVDDDETTEGRPTFLDDDNEQRKRVNFNKSRLLPQHRNVLHEKLPYSEPQSWIHLTEKYQRKIYGRYGAASNIDARILFPTQSDLQEQALKERIAHPHTLKEMMQIVREEQQKKVEKILKREEEIAAKLGKLEQWKQELKAKTAKKEADAQAAKDRKERLVEEVRRHFGFKVDPREERFKELLEKKEKEEKRKEKEARKKVKEEKMMVKLLQKNAQPAEKELDNAEKQ